MERFKASTASRYRPIASLHATLDADAVVRTVSTHRTLTSLLDSTPASTPTPTPPASPSTPPIRLTHNETPAPSIWLNAASRLHTSLSNPASPAKLIASYTTTLEAVTTVSDHDHLSTPHALFLCAWVAEPHLQRSLSTLLSSARPSTPPVSAAGLAALQTPPPPPRVLLVSRKGSRQDEAARPAAHGAAQAAHPDRVHHLVLGESDGPESATAIASVIEDAVRDALAAAIEHEAKTVEKLRKASRASFRAWFAGPPPAVPTRAPVLPPSAVSGVTADDAAATAAGPPVVLPPPRRRLSVGSAGVQTPLFPVDSLEARTRHLADLYMLSGRYADSLDAFRLLQGDLRSLAGPALVHEAAVWEMFALMLALVDGSKQGVGTAFEHSIQLYCRAGRPEMAVRATLRAVQFCLEAGFPDSAAGVIIRAIEPLLPPRAPGFIVGGFPPSGSTFLEAALGVLYTSCGQAYSALSRRRRASLYAFLAATRFSQLKLHAAAACVVHDVDEKALLRSGVRDDIDLILGSADLADGRAAPAVSHFVSVMADAERQNDVEVQGIAIRSFLEAIANGNAQEAMLKRWDAGAPFPLVQGSLTVIRTHDSSDIQGDPVWKTLEDDVLEDHEFFASLEVKSSQGASLPERERRVESIIAELRKKKETGTSVDPGGSLEMKIKRMREVAESRRKRRRTQSLLHRGAIVGERISAQVTIRNPLQFPVFVTRLAAVVSLDGKCYSAQGGDPEKERTGESEDMPIEFMEGNDVMLAPCSSQLVTVNICVKQPGVLQFLGVTWAFTIGMGGASPKAAASMAPGFCILERRGRRLNDNRRQRASEVPLYEKDESLFVTVAPPAPKLRATIMCPVDGGSDQDIDSLTLRAGETREARLVLKNEGSQLLENIVIRIGTPQTVFVNIVPDEVSQEETRTFFAIGMDDEFAHQDEVITAAKMSLNLKPKEKIELGVWLRAAVPRTAFGYRSSSAGKKEQRGEDLGEDEQGRIPCSVRLIIAYGKPKVRVSRINAQFKVQPSILVSPRFLREADEGVFSGDYSTCRGVLLGLEVEHGVQSKGENLIFQVTELSVTSRCGWKAMPLAEPSDLQGIVPNEMEQSFTVLRINETATIFLLVVREKDHKEASTERIVGGERWRTFSVNLSARQARERHVEHDVKNGKPKYGCQPEQEDFERRASTHFVICANRSSHSSSSLQPGKRDLVYVALRWKSSSKVHGEVHIPPIDPLRWMKRRNSASPPGEEGLETLIDEKESVHNVGCGPELFGGPTPLSYEQCEWLQVKVNHPTTLEHDFFGKSPNSNAPEIVAATPSPAVVAVTVSVRNVSPFLLDVVFAAPATGGISDGDRGRFWAGDVSMSLRALGPGAERLLHLSAVLVRPGRYNMSKFSVFYQPCGYSSGTIRMQIQLESSYLTLSSMGGPDVKEGDCSPLTVMKRQLLPHVAHDESTSSAKEGPEIAQVQDQTVEVMKNNLKTDDSSCNGSPVHRADNPVSKRSMSESQVSNLATTASMEAEGEQPSAINGGPANTSLAKSHKLVDRGKRFSRACSDGTGLKLFKGSADDALWDASDTDESGD